MVFLHYVLLEGGATSVDLLFRYPTNVAFVLLIFVPYILVLSLLAETVDDDTGNQVIEDNRDEAEEEINVEQEEKISGSLIAVGSIRLWNDCICNTTTISYTLEKISMKDFYCNYIVDSIE